MPHCARERSNIAHQIKSILDSYPHGNAILRELLQNSDDAKARSQIFILDTRVHPSDSVVDPVLKDTQGPSLLAINDTTFEPSDWEALRSINGSNKIADQEKTGIYGLGFRACYHLTDNPHILSGGCLQIFDPHDRFTEPYAGGLFLTCDEASIYPDHYKAFQASDISPSEDFHGTVIRLPLRTPIQAQQSLIKNQATSIGDLRALFLQFCKGELDISLLFLRHIRKIELKEITPEGEEVLIGKVENVDGTFSPSNRTTGSVFQTFRYQICRTLPGLSSKTTSWRLCYFRVDLKEACDILSRTLSRDVTQDVLLSDKLIPDIGLAIPLNQSSIHGSLFRTLPLPIRPNIPLHLNSSFALTSDRQHLKKDDGASKQRREGLLVAWNRAIFNNFAPSAWASLLVSLASEDQVSDIWSAWPPPIHPSSNHSYWFNLLPNLFHSLVKQNLPVFPMFNGETDTKTYINLRDSYIVSADDKVTVLKLLASVGFSLVYPPIYIYSILVPKARDLGLTLLSPGIIAEALHNNVTSLTDLSVQEKNVLLDYLLSKNPSNLKILIGLPLIPLVTGERVALQLPSVGGVNHVIPSTETAEALFQELDPNMISISRLSPNTRRLFTEYTRTNVNISPSSSFMKSAITYLQKKTQSLTVHAHEAICDEAIIHWLIRFWKWSGASDVSRHWDAKDLHIIPTRSQTARTPNDYIAVTTGLSDAAISAWSRLGVHFLHGDVPPRKCSGVTLNDHISFFLGLVDLTQPCQLKSDDWEAITSSLTTAMGKRNGASLNASLKQHHFAKLLKFPIFPTVCNLLDGNSCTTIRKLGAIVGQRIMIKGIPSCPVPILDTPTTFLDALHSVDFLRQLFPTETLKALDEPAILQMAIEHWDLQPQPVQAAFITRIISRLTDLSDHSHRKLRSLPFVPVGSAGLLKSPCDVVDPQSKIATIYDPEEIWPSGDFAPGMHYLRALQSHGMLRNKLSPDQLGERITYISVQSSSTVAQKASALLQYLNESWSEDFMPVLERYQDIEWIPCTNGSLAAPRRCQVSSIDPLLFDQYFSTTELPVLNPSLQRALGWDNDLAVDIVLRQFAATLGNPHLPDRDLRFTILIKHLSQRPMLEQEFKNLKEMISNVKWIPVLPSGLATTRDAVLSDDFIGGAFKQVVPSLTSSFAFLRKLGCCDRPSADALFSAYMSHTNEPMPASLTPWIVRLLGELARHLSSLKGLLIPDASGRWVEIKRLVYDDFGNGVNPALGSSTHPCISRELAGRFRIGRLSSVQIGDDDEDNMLSMSEDLLDRVHNVLEAHDIQYALNEFLANAQDAGATNFFMGLDHRSFQTRGQVVSPELGNLQSQQAMILYNNSIFTNDDFSCITKIGLSNKANCTGTIGMRGLGALSMFYFTDAVTIVSGKHVLILDPYGTHLPPDKDQRKRTAFFRPLSSFLRHYPDQLRPLDGLFGFSLLQEEYNGTIFRLPLRCATSVSREKVRDGPTCRKLLESYKDLGMSALFFTTLTTITAAEISSPLGIDSSPQFHCLWSATANRRLKTPSDSTPSDSCTFHTLEITVTETDINDTKAWIIAERSSPSSSLPTEFRSILSFLKIPQEGNITVQIAFPDLNIVQSPHYLFSPLRLSRPTGLPCHLHAPFVLSADRREILDGNHYNYWILEKLIPPLYARSLREFLRQSPPTHLKYLPSRSDNHVVSRIYGAFFDHLEVSNHAIFPTVTGAWTSMASAVFSSTEPPTIKHVLNMLEVTNFVVLSQELAEDVLPAWFPRVTPMFLRSQLLNKSDEFCQLFRQKKIDRTGVYTILDFIRGSEILHNLPLLFVQCSRIPLVRFGNHSTPSILHIEPNNPFHPFNPLIDPKRILYKDMPYRLVHYLLNQASLNIKELGIGELVKLIEERTPRRRIANHSEETAKWIDDFWGCAMHVPELPSQTISDFPLIPTYQQGCYVSHSFYLSSNSTVLPDGLCPKALFQVLNNFGLHIVKTANNLVVTNFLGTQNPEPTFQLFVERLRSSGKTGCAFLKVQGHEQLAEWIREQSEFDTLTDSAKQILVSLPIWPACRHGSVKLCAAKEIRLLPFSISHNSEIIARYHDPDFAVSSSNRENLKLLGCQEVALATLMDSLNLPQSLPQPLLTPYANFIIPVIPDVYPFSLKLPDGNLHLKLTTELYDDSNPLYTAAFQTEKGSRFIHPAIRNRLQHIKSLDIHRSTTFTTFLTSAKFIDHDLQKNGMDECDVIQRAQTIYKSYITELPAIIMTNSGQWVSLENLRFIPRAADRCRHASYDVHSYFAPDTIDAILSPSKMVRREFEMIAWTQRGLFEQEPPQDILAVHPSFGQPTVGDVVNHLCALALTIAPHCPQNQTLKQEIQATYEWLNAHADEAREHLILHVEKAIFLNVNDPIDDKWDWQPAKKLVLNLRFDHQKGYNNVRAFLAQYSAMLLAAGGTRIEDAHYQRDDEDDAGALVSTTLRQTLNEMRESDELTDLTLWPVEISHKTDNFGNNDSWPIISPSSWAHVNPFLDLVSVSGNIRNVFVEPDESKRLRCHRAFLAAAVPHFRDDLRRLGWLTGRYLKFQGSFFEAEKLIEFIYTGKLTIDEGSQLRSDPNALLHHFLDLLSTAHRLDMKALKDEVGRFIVNELRLLSLDSCHTILEAAGKCHAPRLVKACKDFKFWNVEIIYSHPDGTLRLQAIAEFFVELIQERVQPQSIASHTDETARLIDNFWHYVSQVPGVLNYAPLHDFPLIPTYQGYYVSRSFCLSMNSTVLPDGLCPEALFQTLSGFGLHVAKTAENPVITQFLGTPLKPTFEFFLERLHSSGKTGCAFLEVQGHELLAEWIREQPEFNTLTSDRAIVWPV